MTREFDVAIASAENDSREVESLLRKVYVDGGFTDPQVAESLFAASEVFRRGDVLVARDRETNALAGVVIVVPADSPARRLAVDREVEMHLLAVGSDFRKAGLGRLLVASAIDFARRRSAPKMLLWTQPTMTAAHRLYEREGFERVPALDFERSGRAFLVYERRL